MSVLGPHRVDIRFVCERPFEPMVRSLRSVCDVLLASRGALEAVADRLGVEIGTELAGGAADLLLDRIDLIIAESVLRPAGGALELVINPSVSYFELVTAIAGRGDLSVDGVFHG